MSLSVTKLARATNSTVVTSASNAYTAGQLVIAATEFDNNSSPTGTMSQSSGAWTWTLAARSNANSATCAGVDIWWAIATSVTTTVSCTVNAGGSNMGMDVMIFSTSVGSFSSSAPIGATATVSLPTATTAFTNSITTTAANSWCWGMLMNHTTFATVTANGSSQINHTGNDGGGNTGASFAHSSVTTQPTVSSGTNLTLGGTFVSAAKGQVVIIEILDPASVSTVTGNFFRMF